MLPRTIIHLLLALLPLAQAGAQIVVTYRGDAPNAFKLPGGTDPGVSTDTAFDVNGDDIADFRFISDGHFVAAMQGYNGNRFISVLSTGWDVGGNVVPVEAGSLIGPDTTSLSGNWHHHTDNGGGTHFGLLGPMQFADAYIGAEFKVLDEIHYGWIHYIGFSHPEKGLVFPVPGGFINSWAYNSIPGEPIHAGEVPEPTTVALFAGISALGAAVILRRKWRVRQILMPGTGRAFPP
jgi:hypothetical protein